MATYQTGLERGRGASDDWFDQNGPAVSQGPTSEQRGPGYRATPEDVQESARRLFGHELSDPTPWVGQTDWEKNLANTEEAQNYARTQKAGGGPKPAAGGGDPVARMKAARAAGDNAGAKAAFEDYYRAKGVEPEDWDTYWGPKIMGADGDYYIDDKLPQSEAFGNPGPGAGGSYLDPFTEQFKFDDFVAPTGVTEENDPGFQARLKTGQDALEHSAAARGSLLTGNTLQATSDYAQDYASNEFEKVYGRALDTYKTNYGKAFGEYQDRKSTFYSNQNNPFSKLLAQESLDSSNQNYLSGLGLQYANLFANTTQTGSRSYTDYLTGGANAGAAGEVGSGNAWQNAFGQAGNNALQAYFMSQYGKGRGTGAGAGT